MPEPRPLPPDGPLYFVGIGGAGMSALAYVLAARGRRIIGADPGIAPAVRARLEAVGCQVFSAHDPAQIPAEVAAVIATDAVKEDHIELAHARAREVPVVRRPEALATIINDAKTSLCVAGTHGKTTTTGMIANILIHAGLDPTVLVGGDFAFLPGGNARLGDPDLVVAEACEAYGGLDWLRPTVAVITNIEPDHLDFHRTEEAFHAAFARFAGKAGAVVRGEGMPTRIDVALRVPGVHNVQNALTACLATQAIGVSRSLVDRGLKAFTPAGRRFEMLGEYAGITVVDDYAHHPTEIRATLAAAREAFPGRRIVAAFQPHLPSRTRDFLEGFAAALADGADVAYLTEIYLAREPAEAGLAQRLAEAAGAVFVADRFDLAVRLAADLEAGDVAVVMGAGDIRETAERLVTRLAKR